MTKITVIKGDITKQEVDVIINPANRWLSGGGGADGAIHRAAGLRLLEECMMLGMCETGQAKITKGYNLPAKYVVHTVGPEYGREGGKEEDLLSACYLNSLTLAKDQKLKTIAFPAISTGVYGYPYKEASIIAINTAKRFIKDNPNVFNEIRFVVFDDLLLRIYQDLLSN